VFLRNAEWADRLAGRATGVLQERQVFLRNAGCTGPLVRADHACFLRCKDDRVEHEPATVITVTLDADGTTALALSPTEHPVDDLRKAAAVLERYAASIERENEPLLCKTCGSSPTGVRAGPDGEWRLLPCGHSVQDGAQGSRAARARVPGSELSAGG